jgi:hypothetical protein
LQYQPNGNPRTPSQFHAAQHALFNEPLQLLPGWANPAEEFSG